MYIQLSRNYTNSVVCVASISIFDWAAYIIRMRIGIQLSSNHTYLVGCVARASIFS